VGCVGGGVNGIVCLVPLVAWAATRAIIGDNINLDAAIVLAGYTIEGEVDPYVKRNEHLVRACCKRIEDEYFGNGNKKADKK
jgi:hypothetical protein